MGTTGLQFLTSGATAAACVTANIYTTNTLFNSVGAHFTVAYYDSTHPTKDIFTGVTFVSSFDTTYSIGCAKF